mgnify:CR=1 FL=1
MKRNRTSKYLSQIINRFGKTFISEFGNLTAYGNGESGESVLSYSIIDPLYLRAKSISTLDIPEYLFFVLDTRGFRAKNGNFISSLEGTKRFLQFLQFVRTISHYQDDYWFNENQHCFVMKVPQEYKSSYHYFLQSEYSKMYSVEQLKQLGYKKTYFTQGKAETNYVYLVLTKDSQALPVLKKVVYETYGVEKPPEAPAEYDIPWDTAEEVLNFQYLSVQDQEILNNFKYKSYNAN